MGVRTYLRLWFSSEGENPGRITSALMNLGFQPTKGAYDYVYYWRKNPSFDEVLELARQVQLTLRGMRVYYKIETLGLEEAPVV